eukprot:3381412-Pleurochrysis_carterae.AAC.2
MPCSPLNRFGMPLSSRFVRGYRTFSLGFHRVAHRTNTPLIATKHVITSQGRVVVLSTGHAEPVFFRLYTTYSSNILNRLRQPTRCFCRSPPLRRAPRSLLVLSRALNTGARVVSASLPLQPPSVSAPPRALTGSECARFVVSFP